MLENNKTRKEIDYQRKLHQAYLKEQEDKTLQYNEDSKNEIQSLKNQSQELPDKVEDEKETQIKFQKDSVKRIKELAKQKAKEQVKKAVKKKIKKAIVKKILMSPVFWTVVGYALLGLIVVLLIFILIYFITNPCEVTDVIGTWWAELLGSTCETVTGTGT